MVKISGPRRNHMKHTVPLLVALTALVGVVLMPADGQAFGHRRSASCNEVAPPPCNYTVQYVPQTVTRYKQVMAEREVVETVYKQVQREVKFNYTEQVPVVTPTKQKVTTYQCVTKEVPYTYTVQVPVVTPTKQKVTTYQTVAKEVPYTYTVQVPVVTPTKQKVTTYQCVSK